MPNYCTCIDVFDWHQSSSRVLVNFQYGESLPIFGVRDHTLNQYLGSVNSKIDKNSMYGIQKSEERMNRAI